MSATSEIVGKGQLSDRKVRAIELLLSGRSVREVAAELEVHPDSVSRYRQDPLFMREFRRRRGELFDSARAVIEATQRRAVDTLAALLEHDEARIHLRAATVLLQAGGHLASDIGVEARCERRPNLAEIRARLAEFTELRDELGEAIQARKPLAAQQAPGEGRPDAGVVRNSEPGKRLPGG